MGFEKVASHCIGFIGCISVPPWGLKECVSYCGEVPFSLQNKPWVFVSLLQNEPWVLGMVFRDVGFTLGFEDLW